METIIAHHKEKKLHKDKENRHFTTYSMKKVLDRRANNKLKKKTVVPIEIENNDQNHYEQLANDLNEIFTSVHIESNKNKR